MPTQYNKGELTDWVVNHETENAKAMELMALARQGAASDSSRDLTAWLNAMASGVRSVLTAQEGEIDAALGRAASGAGAPGGDGQGAIPSAAAPGAPLPNGTLPPRASAGLGYATLRRVLVAALVREWLQHGQQSSWDAPVHRSALDLLHQLYHLHVSGMSGRGLLEFLHISKAGGTSTCLASGNNNCRTYDATERRTCLLYELNDRPRWLEKGVHNKIWGTMAKRLRWSKDVIDKTKPTAFMYFGKLRNNQDPLSASCAARAEYVRQHAWNFYANEYTPLTTNLTVEGLSRAWRRRVTAGELGYRAVLPTAMPSATAAPGRRRRSQEEAEAEVEEVEAEAVSDDWAALEAAMLSMEGPLTPEQLGLQQDGGPAAVEEGPSGGRAGPGRQGPASAHARAGQLQTLLAGLRARVSRRLRAAAEPAADGKKGGEEEEEEGSGEGEARSRVTKEKEEDPGQPGDLGRVQTCREFAGVVVFRSPVKRIMSHLQMLLEVYVRCYQLSGAAEMLGGKGLKVWRHLAPAIADNYFIRTMCGEAVYNMAAGRITRRHLRAARAMLTQYDVLHILESTPEATSATFHFGLGWRHTILQEHGRIHNANSSNPVLKWLPAGEEVEELKRANALDEELYRYAVLLSSLDQVVWQAQQVAHLPPYAGFVPEGDAARLPKVRAIPPCGLVGLRVPRDIWGGEAYPPPPPWTQAPQAAGSGSQGA